MSSTRPPPQKPLDLDLTIISAKHLNNVNWKNGDLKPYAVFWVDPDGRSATKSDDSGSTRPVWNERFSLPIYDAVLTLEIFHSKLSETTKPLIATLRVPLNDLPDPDPNLHTHPPFRSSSRQDPRQIGIRERPLPDYHIAPPLPPPSYYYTSAPPPLPPRDYRSFPNLRPLPSATNGTVQRVSGGRIPDITPLPRLRIYRPDHYLNEHYLNEQLVTVALGAG